MAFGVMDGLDDELRNACELSSDHFHRITSVAGDSARGLRTGEAAILSLADHGQLGPHRRYGSAGPRARVIAGAAAQAIELSRERHYVALMKMGLVPSRIHMRM